MTNVYYFGPLNEAGHYLHDQSHRVIWPERIGPWRTNYLDGGLCPNVSPDEGWKRTGPEIEGDAILHHKDGWTALAFWDRTVDTRPACCSVYVADGVFSFEEIAALAQDAFKSRWDRMKFKVRNSQVGKVANELDTDPLDRGCVICEITPAFYWVVCQCSCDCAERVCKKHRGKCQCYCRRTGVGNLHPAPYDISPSQENAIRIMEDGPLRLD